MLFRILSICFLLLLFLINPKTEIQKQEKIETIIDFNLSKYQIEVKEKEKYFDHSVEKNRMIQEIHETWENIFDSVNASPDDDRRSLFNYYATLTSDVIRKYQNKNYYSKFYLPNNRYTHILISWMIYKESSVNHLAISKTKRREVGLLQVWGAALKKKSRKEVLSNPKLGLELGISWLAENIYDCKMENKIKRIEDWGGVLSYYGMGPRAKKGNKCSPNFLFSKKRIKFAKKFRNMLKTKESRI